MELLKRKSDHEEEASYPFAHDDYQKNLQDSSIIHRLLNIKTDRKDDSTEEGFFASKAFKKYFFIGIAAAALNFIAIVFLGFYVFGGDKKSKNTFASSDTDLESLEMLSMDISAKLNSLSFFVYNKLDKLGPGGTGAFSDSAVLTEKLQEIKDRIDPTKKLSEPAALGQISSSKRMQFFIQLRVNRYFREKKAYPQNRAEFLEALEGDIPVEDISHSSRLSFDKDNLGGWFFDKGTGKIMPNVP